MAKKFIIPIIILILIAGGFFWWKNQTTKEIQELMRLGRAQIALPLEEKPEEGIGQEIKEKEERPTPEKEVAEVKPQPIPELTPEERLAEIRERLDDISERIDVLSQKVTKLTGTEIQPLQEEVEEKREEEKIVGKEDLEETEEEEEEEIGQEEIGQTAPTLCQRLTGSYPARNKVIFNEIAWMGTIVSASDEWIEFKNISGTEIDLTGWQILNKDQKIKIVFSEHRMSTSGFLLLERTGDETVPGVAADLIYTGALKNEDETLYLFDENCQLQDEVEANPNWPAGDNETKRTMERKSDFSWQTSANPGGTPKMENSSGYYIYYGSDSPIEKEPKISLSYPLEIAVNKEIEVNFSASELNEATYDIKISIEKDEVLLSEIYNQSENKWQSSFYYLKEVFSGNSFQGQFKLRIKEEKQDFRGEADILVRIRESGKTKYFQFIGKINIIEPETPKDATPPSIISFDIISDSQNRLLLALSWLAIDPVDNVSPSGIDGFSLQYTVTPPVEGVALQYQEGEEWKDWIEGETKNFSAEINSLALLGKDEKSYNFKIKAKDIAGNESEWVEISTKISLPKNLLKNEFFEEWEEEIPKNWEWNGASARIYKSAEDPFYGNYNVVLKPIASHDRLEQTIEGIMNTTYYGTIWAKGIKGARVRIGIKRDGHYQYGDYIKLENNEWTKINYSRNSREGSNDGIIISVLESEDGDRPEIIIGAAWLGTAEPPESWPF